mmetsp:Transcript_8497/g.13029  ORF Transcript_8497/g.13029 Transcript_8497/m.13029 type:complete len:207 (-) Transcript_8497:4397-5017(-)
MIENELLAQIMDNLKNPSLYVPRVSNQVSMGKDFEIEMKKLNHEQVFDMASFEAKSKHYQALLQEKQKALLNKVLKNDALATHNAHFRDQILFQVAGKQSELVPEEEEHSSADEGNRGERRYEAANGSSEESMTEQETDFEIDVIDEVKAELMEAENHIINYPHKKSQGNNEEEGLEEEAAEDPYGRHEEDSEMDFEDPRNQLSID